MSHVELADRPETRKEIAVSIVDTDVHPAPSSPDVLRSYVPEPWRSRKWSDMVFDAVGSPIYEAPNRAQRRDSYSPAGGPPCSDPVFTEQQLFGDAAVDYAILFPLTVRPMANPDHEAAVCAATNAWLADTWLTRFNGHGRYFGTLRVCSTDAQLAAAEIERWAGHPAFIQVMMNPYTDAPVGQARYHPVYEAATRHGLPVALHVNRSPGMRLLTPVGFASYFIEHHSLYPMMYAAHLASLIFEGVFEKFPTLKVSLVEGGFSWVVPLAWRMDNHWRQLRSEVPHVKRSPSEYIRDHVRFSSQPIEEPSEQQHLKKMLDWMDAGRLLMFATDYPHWDFDDPHQLRIPKEIRRRVMADNALEWYGLSPTRTE